MKRVARIVAGVLIVLLAVGSLALQAQNAKARAQRAESALGVVNLQLVQARADAVAARAEAAQSKLQGRRNEALLRVLLRGDAESRRLAVRLLVRQEPAPTVVVVRPRTGTATTAPQPAPRPAPVPSPTKRHGKK